MAARKTLAPKTRSLLIAIKNRNALKGVSSEAMVAELRRSDPESLKLEVDDILHIGLIKLANDACRRKSGRFSNLQIEMFAEYGAPPMVVLRVVGASGRTEFVHKAVEGLTVTEAKQYVADNTRIRAPLSKGITEIMRMVDELAPHGQPDWLLSRCWKAKQSALRRARS